MKHIVLDVSQVTNGGCAAVGVFGISSELYVDSMSVWFSRPDNFILISETDARFTK